MRRKGFGFGLGLGFISLLIILLIFLGFLVYWFLIKGDGGLLGNFANIIMENVSGFFQSLINLVRL